MKSFSYFIFAILLLTSTQLFSQDYFNKLETRAHYDLFCGEPLANKYGNVTAVKIVYDINHDKLYYLSSRHYKNHYVFCEKRLNYLEGNGNFFKRNYSDGNFRKYLLSNINYFHAIDKYVIDISPIDLMSVEQIVQFFNLIKSSSFVGENLYFLINSPRLHSLKEQISKDIPTINPSEIYGHLSYQPVSKYKNVGILRIVEDIEKLDEAISPNDILVLKNIPNYLPAVAGVIVTEFQTPLSHISILGLNRKIPICAYTNAFNNNIIEQYAGKQVCFSVKADTFYIALDTSELKTIKHAGVKVKMDLSVDSIIDVDDLYASSIVFVGGKAANFGELYHLSKISNFKTPECALGIPFYFYKEHEKNSKADKLIQKLDDNTPDNDKSIHKKLEKIRLKIEKTPVDPLLLDAIAKKLEANGKYTKFRFRSSTNAEDIEGFSGAGLYTSESAELNNPNKTIEHAIQKVWASLWSYQAFVERQYFNIDQQNVAMGILVHRSFPKEKVNGVAVTKNIYRKSSNGFLVNAQLGEASVVKPEHGVVCDQFLCFPANSNAIYKDKIVIDVITYSSLNNNELVMTEEEIQNLANQLAVVKKHFAGPKVDQWSYTKLGYDVEFKLDGKDRQLYIKQVRPYND